MSIVYMTKEITPESLVRIYHALGISLPGSVAVKISTGEPGGRNFLQPELIRNLVRFVPDARRSGAGAVRHHAGQGSARRAGQHSLRQLCR